MATTVSRRYSVADQPRVTVSERHDSGRESNCDVRTVVSLKGELDSAALNSLVVEFADAIAHDDSDVVVDLADVEFIGAAWIGTLVQSRAVLRAQDRDLTLRSPSGVVHRLLDLCGLSYLVEPVDVASG
jgi:anti-anti-sigma factor